jgi:hypothetical protein
MLEQCVEERAPGRIGKRPEHRLHNMHNRKPNGFLSRVDSWSSLGAQDVLPMGVKATNGLAYLGTLCRKLRIRPTLQGTSDGWT